MNEPADTEHIRSSGGYARSLEQRVLKTNSEANARMLIDIERVKHLCHIKIILAAFLVVTLIGGLVGLAYLATATNELSTLNDAINNVNPFSH